MPAPALKSYTAAELQKMDFQPHPEIILRLQPDNGAEPEEIAKSLIKLLKELRNRYGMECVKWYQEFGHVTRGDQIIMRAKYDP